MSTEEQPSIKISKGIQTEHPFQMDAAVILYTSLANLHDLNPGNATLTQRQIGQLIAHNPKDNKDVQRGEKRAVDPHMHTHLRNLAEEAGFKADIHVPTPKERKSGFQTIISLISNEPVLPSESKREEMVVYKAPIQESIPTDTVKTSQSPHFLEELKTNRTLNIADLTLYMARPDIHGKQKQQIIDSAVKSVVDGFLDGKINLVQFRGLITSLYRVDLFQYLPHALVKLEDYFPIAAENIPTRMMEKLGYLDIDICGPARMAAYIRNLASKIYYFRYKPYIFEENKSPDNEERKSIDDSENADTTHEQLRQVLDHLDDRCITGDDLDVQSVVRFLRSRDTGHVPAYIKTILTQLSEEGTLIAADFLELLDTRHTQGRKIADPRNWRKPDNYLEDIDRVFSHSHPDDLEEILSKIEHIEHAY